MNFPTLDFSTLDLGLRSLGLKLGVEKSGAEMSSNHFSSPILIQCIIRIMVEFILLSISHSLISIM